MTDERFTIADISIGYAFVLLDFTKVECTLPANVSAYRGRLMARPAFLRAQQK